MRQVVATEDAHAARADHAAGKRAAVVGQPGFAGDERAVFLRAEFHAHERAGRRARPFKDLVALHRHLHRPAAFPAEQGGDRLQIDGDLAAEAAADFARHDQALAKSGICSSSADLLPAVERALRGGPDFQPAVFVPHGDGGVRLDVALMHAGRAKLPLDDDIRLLEAVGDVPFLELEMRRRRCVGLSPFLPIESVRRSVVQERRVVLHRVENPGDARQHLVLDLDSCRRFLGHVCVRRRDRRDGVPLVEHLVLAPGSSPPDAPGSPLPPRP